MESIHNYAVYQSSVVDITFSPDDGGWYVRQSKLEKPLLSRVSRKTFVSSYEAKRAFDQGKIKWSEWS
jgi:hypothetical protein